MCSTCSQRLPRFFHWSFSESFYLSTFISGRDLFFFVKDVIPHQCLLAIRYPPTAVVYPPTAVGSLQLLSATLQPQPPPPFRSPELPERAGTFCRNVGIL